jgi:hypothetical protein
MSVEVLRPPAYGLHEHHTIIIPCSDGVLQSPPSYPTATANRQAQAISTYSTVSQIPDYQFQNACPHCLFLVLRKKLKVWVAKQKKPYTAVTVQIEQLTSEEYDENDMSGIPDLVEVIRIQDTGPTEAARAIRKKLYVGPFLQLYYG